MKAWVMRLWARRALDAEQREALSWSREELIDRWERGCSVEVIRISGETQTSNPTITHIERIEIT